MVAVSLPGRGAGNVGETVFLELLPVVRGRHAGIGDHGETGT